ncbi:hypothetical protein DFH94DRAFT_746382 [Russula ochroleuca]|uniref:Uncharacterized protein n=1 Tax=Russula ochroleuca TaxID=152965 RepID=A0A9P5MUH2_9AGAM|nr:hypothetical protein DFH94DRAFT_746382 [Russula ochroleuca]
MTESPRAPSDRPDLSRTTMGSASSKAARASAGKKPSVRMPAYEPRPSPVRTQQPWASESKNEEIQRDAKDPQLLANLSRLKPVHVHHHRLPTGTKDHVRELFESRARAEDEAVGTRTPHNRLHVSSLVALLEERRDMVIGAGGNSTTALAATRQLAEKYGLDVERLERLVRCVNVPSVRKQPLGGGAGVGTVRDAESGEDIVVKEVEWKEPTHSA